MREQCFRGEGEIRDVPMQEDLERVVGRTIEVYGEVYILLNNAVVSRGERPEVMPRSTNDER
ncbi:MAG TPA: hypothetical protein VF717_10205 [Pyrinomonadaceae bacterium]|jgi:hypothetical protein